MRIIGITGWSGAGKTSLITRLIPYLVGQGLSVSTLKHAHHRFEIDVPGKDSYEHRVAGAREVMISSRTRFALVHELRDAEERTLGELLGKFESVDVVLVEGFKRERHPKIEVYRQCVGKPKLHPGDDTIIAVASDVPLPEAGRPVFALDDIAGIAAVALAHAAPVEAVRAGSVGWRN